MNLNSSIFIVIQINFLCDSINLVFCYYKLIFLSIIIFIDMITQSFSLHILIFENMILKDSVAD